jgi:murein DD-endopeptidase MepM/ murein hydrolase activator NlpD
MFRFINYVVLLLFLIVNNSISQIYFPLNDYSADDFSSSYGPRYYGSDNYDFHAAIDIATLQNTEVYAVCAGKVTMLKYDAGNPNKRWVLIRHNDGFGEFFVLYMHIYPDPVIEKGTTVTEDSRIGFVDFRFCSTFGYTV